MIEEPWRRAERSSQRISVEDYLRGEEESRIRHEYLDGQVYPTLKFKRGSDCKR